MNQLVMKKPRFKKTETYYHKCAVDVLAEWVGGIVEPEFKVDGKLVFVPDVAVYTDGRLNSIYEVVHSHPVTGKKYGMIQYYCYMNVTSILVHEVSADFILSQKEKPDRIVVMDCYTVDPFEYDEIQDYLIKPIS